MKLGSFDILDILRKSMSMSKWQRYSNTISCLLCHSLPLTLTSFLWCHVKVVDVKLLLVGPGVGAPKLQSINKALFNE
jgi:hypothetical protein